MKLGWAAGVMLPSHQTLPKYLQWSVWYQNNQVNFLSLYSRRDKRRRVAPFRHTGNIFCSFSFHIFTPLVINTYFCKLIRYFKLSTDVKPGHPLLISFLVSKTGDCQYVFLFHSLSVSKASTCLIFSANQCWLAVVPAICIEYEYFELWQRHNVYKMYVSYTSICISGATICIRGASCCF